MNYNTRAVGWKNGGPGVLPLGGVSKACPDLFEGSFLNVTQYFYCFLKVFMVSAQGRFGIGAFCFKTKDTRPRGYERENNKFLVLTPTT